MTLHQKARKAAKKALRKCGIIWSWSSTDNRYIEIVVKVLMEFNRGILEEIAREFDKRGCACWAMCNIDETRPHDPTCEYCPRTQAQVIRRRLIYTEGEKNDKGSNKLP